MPIDELREMKAMALDSANAHNSDSDRKTIQKVFSSRIEGIDDIAVSTNYNGIPLLDGRWWGNGMGGSSSSNETENPIDISDYTPVSQPVRPASVSPTIIPTGDYTITQDGVYQLDYNYVGKVTISAENVEIRQSNFPNAIIGDVSFVCTRDNTNLWLNVNIAKTTPGSLIRFGAGTDNTLNLVGGHSVCTVNCPAKDYNEEAIVNVGGGLTIFDGDGTGGFGVGGHGGGINDLQPLIMGAVIGSDGNEKSKANITINGGSISLHLGNPTGIGSGANGSIGNIFINGGTIRCFSEGGAGSEHTRTGAAIGSGYMGTVEGSIVINGGTITSANKICDKIRNL